MRLVFRRDLAAVCHYKLLAEYREVLERMVKQGDLTYSQAQMQRLLGAFVTATEEVEVRYLWRPNLRDEGDNFVYELAVAASPSTIVAHNVRDFRNPEIAWPSVWVMTPQQVLKKVRKNA